MIANTYTRGVRGNNGRDTTKDPVCKRELPECSSGLSACLLMTSYDIALNEGWEHEDAHHW